MSSRRLLAGLVAFLVTLCLTTSASAHAVLVSAQPADGSVVTEAPKMVVLRFNEAVAPTAVSLLDATGKPRDVTVHAVDRSVQVALPDDLPQGTQVISYRVVSQDGHPVAGSLLFSVGIVTGAVLPSDGSAIDPLIWLARVALYLGLFVGVGGAFFAAWIGQGAGRRGMAWALAVGLMGAVASFGLQGLELLNLPLSGLATRAVWRAALATSVGPAMIIAIAALLIAAFSLGRFSRFTSAVAMIGVGIALAASGHAATASPQWLTRPAVFIHGTGLAYWLGALVPLAAMAWRRSEALPQTLTRFSAIAVPVVGLIALSGLTLAIVQLDRFGALIDTRYGNILAIKLALVVLLLLFAALNRFIFTPTVVRDIKNAKPLLRSIIGECIVAVAILGLVAGWRFTPPPRVLEMSPDVPLAIHIHTDAAMFQVLIAPGKVGQNDFTLQLMNGDASPFVAKEATLVLSLPERDIAPMERSATLGPDGYWHVKKASLPFAGRWHMRIDALVTDFKKVTLEDDFDAR